MIFTGGVTDWRKLSHLDYPLPEAIAIVLGRASSFTKIFASIGLFGLIASFHGTILASSRQLFALARSGYLPRRLAKVNHKFQTPHWAIIAGGVISFIAIYKLDTSKIIVLSVMGAVLMYMMSMISLFILRIKEPGLERSFKSPFYPIFPTIALFISTITLFAIIYYNFKLSLYFFEGLALVLILFILMGKHKVKLVEDLMISSVPNKL
jgi:ethanolamine permease